MMAELIRQAQLVPITRETALGFLKAQGAGSVVRVLNRLTQWVRLHVRLINEPVETLYAPAWVLNQIHLGERVFGDCDDVAMLVGTLVLALGIPVRLVAIRPPGGPEFVHVFTEAEVNTGQWMFLDPTSRRTPPEDWQRMVVNV